MSKTTKELVALLNIPEDTKYPTVDFNVDGNIFSVIGTVSKAWRKVNPEVAEKIASVVNTECESYEQALGFLLSISDATHSGYDSDDECECDYECDE